MPVEQPVVGSAPELSFEVGDRTALASFHSGPSPNEQTEAVFSVVRSENNDGLTNAVDQAPGQSGVIDGNDGVMWRCPDCRILNHRSNAACANCRAQRPHPVANIPDIDPAAAIERLTKRKLAIEADRQALEDELQAVQRVMDAQREKELAELETLQRQQEQAVVLELLSQVNLLDIAETGDAHLLQELEKLGALNDVPDINQAFFYTPGGWTTRASLTICFVFAANQYILQKMSALMIASYEGHTTVVQLLLKVSGINVNLQDDQVI